MPLCVCRKTISSTRWRRRTPNKGKLDWKGLQDHIDEMGYEERTTSLRAGASLVW
jgi:hypothetical protein